MKLGRVRFLLFVFGALSVILVTLGGVLRVAPVLYAGLLCFILAVLVRFRFYRCPHCHKQLGQHTGLRCPYCGERL